MSDTLTQQARTALGPAIPVDEPSSRNGFAPSSYDRRDDLRGLASPDGDMFETVRFVLVAATGDRALLKIGDEGARLDPLFTRDEAAQQGADLTGDTHPPIFLGAENAIGLFGVAVPAGEQDDAPYRPGSDGRIEEGLPDAGGVPVKAIDLRSVAAAGLADGNLDQGFAALIATTRSLLDWHHRHRFCARCGTASEVAQSGWRRDCPSCKASHFPRVDPVVIMTATRGDRILLGRQAHFQPGMYSTLAGFMEPGETLEDAVRREILEESGIVAGRVRYHSCQPWPFPSSLMIGCLADAQTESIRIDENELEDARWFSRSDARAMLARTHSQDLFCPPPLAIAHRLIAAFVDAD
jgi:NAD+ diphosphatase